MFERKKILFPGDFKQMIAFLESIFLFVELLFVFCVLSDSLSLSLSIRGFSTPLLMIGTLSVRVCCVVILPFEKDSVIGSKRQAINNHTLCFKQLYMNFFNNGY